MKAFKVTITRLISTDQPGFVECMFKDAWGQEYKIEEKIPVVTKEYLDENSEYPKAGVVACEIVRVWEDINKRKLITVNTVRPWAVETVDGLTQFDVLQREVIEI